MYANVHFRINLLTSLGIVSPVGRAKSFWEVMPGSAPQRASERRSSVAVIGVTVRSRDLLAVRVHRFLRQMLFVTTVRAQTKVTVFHINLTSTLTCLVDVG